MIKWKFIFIFSFSIFLTIIISLIHISLHKASVFSLWSFLHFFRLSFSSLLSSFDHFYQEFFLSQCHLFCLPQIHWQIFLFSSYHCLSMFSSCILALYIILEPYLIVLFNPILNKLSNSSSDCPHLFHYMIFHSINFWRNTEANISNHIISNDGHFGYCLFCLNLYETGSIGNHQFSQDWNDILLAYAPRIKPVLGRTFQDCSISF